MLYFVLSAVSRPSQTCPRFVSDIVLKFVKRRPSRHCVLLLGYSIQCHAHVHIYIYGHRDLSTWRCSSLDIPLLFNSTDGAGSCRDTPFLRLFPSLNNSWLDRNCFGKMPFGVLEDYTLPRVPGTVSLTDTHQDGGRSASRPILYVTSDPIFFTKTMRT
jgi:hypothetical protein